MPSRAPDSAAPRTAKPPWHGIATAMARRFHQICVSRTSELMSPAGLTPLQYGVMLHLSKTTGLPGIEQNSLAERINVDRNTRELARRATCQERPARAPSERRRSSLATP